MSRRTRLGFETFEDRTAPALFTVTNLLDSGPGSLRQAVAEANALAGPDTVRFSLPVASPAVPILTLTTGEIAITDSLTMLGNGLNSTAASNATAVIISGGQASRIFNINGPGTLNVNLIGLGFVAGKASAGGAILNMGENLTLTSCTLSGNSATGHGGAIESIASAASSTNAALSTLTLKSCRLISNHATDGGAVHFTGPGTLTVITSTFDANTSSEEGGAVSFANGGRFTIDSSTLSNNVAGTSGGAIHYVGVSTAIAPPTTNAAGSLLRNSTVSGNSAKFSGGGAAFAAFTSGVVVIANSTITDNAAGANASTIVSTGGGISVSATNTSTSIGLVSVVSSVLSGNRAIIGPDASTPGTLSSSFSALGSSTGIANYVNAGNNLPLGANLQLGSLANNGGPTLTHLPAANSPLVNHGSNPYSLRADQRGGSFKRVAGLQADIGAVERPSPLTTPFAAGDFDPSPFNAFGDEYIRL